MWGGIDWSRVGETLLILMTTIVAASARFLSALHISQDLPPHDVEGARLWWHRFGWAVAGELAACITFVLVAEAIVILRGYDGPVGVLIGAIAATLGYPFVAGKLRRRVEQKLGEDGGQ